MLLLSVMVNSNSIGVPNEEMMALLTCSWTDTPPSFALSVLDMSCFGSESGYFCITPLWCIWKLLKGCIWIKDLARKKELKMEMEKLENPTVQDHWILYLFPFPFFFPHQILGRHSLIALWFEHGFFTDAYVETFSLFHFFLFHCSLLWTNGHLLIKEKGQKGRDDWNGSNETHNVLWLAEQKKQKVSEIKAGLDEAEALVSMCFLLPKALFFVSKF